MSRQEIFLGSVANDGTGTPLREALDMCNDNFIELYAADAAILDGCTFTGDIIVPDEAYGVGWNSSLEAPTKNAIYDKIESILDGQTFTGAIVVPDDAYAVGWNGSTEVPTKNAIYDKIESILDGQAFTGAITVPDDAYAVGWNGSTEVPTKNAVYDKIENLDGLVAKLAGATFTGDIIVPAEAYGVGWNGSNEVPTKNDVYDKIELVVSGGLNPAATTWSAATKTAATTERFLVYTGTAKTDLTLPTAVGNTDLRFTITNRSATDEAFLVIDGNGSETIGGALKWVLYPKQHDTVEIVSDGANWNVLYRNPRVLGGSWIPSGSVGTKSFQFGTDVTDSQFSSVEVFIDGVIPTSDGAILYSRLSNNNGNTWRSGASDYGYQILAASGASVSAASANASSILLLNVGQDNVIENYQQLHILYKAALSASLNTKVENTQWMVDASLASRAMWAFNINSVIERNDAIQFYWSAGNFTNSKGRILVYLVA